jgi:ribosome-associated protein
MPRNASPQAADAFDAPSKSQKKRDSQALQLLGESLLGMSDERLVGLGVPERLHDAIRLARTIRAHEGRRRQLQYIGRLMREDVDVEAIRAAIDAEHSRHRLDTAVMHEAEHWRERVLAEASEADRWLEHWPQTRSRFEPLLTAARSELAGGQRSRNYRDLFRLIRDTLSAQAAADAPPPAQPSEPLADDQTSTLPHPSTRRERRSR